MADTTKRKGACLCGETRFTAHSFNPHLGACHCNMCRKWGGGPFMAVDCGGDVSFEGAENITVFNSSNWAERGFCNKCGSHLFYRIKGSGQHMMPIGLFDEVDGITFDHQVFIDEKPSYYAFVNETSDMTGAEIFAKYGASPEQDSD